MNFELFWAHVQICPKIPTWILLGASFLNMAFRVTGWYFLWSVEQLQSWPQAVFISLDMCMLLTHLHFSSQITCTIAMASSTCKVHCKRIEQEDIPSRSGFPKWFVIYQYLFILIHLHWKPFLRITYTVCIPAT